MICAADFNDKTPFMTHSHRPVILASSSPWRRQLLEQLNLSFETISPDVDETARPDEPGEALARRLAQLKAERIADTHTQAVVIGSDQVAEVNATLLGKPGTRQRAMEQLRLQSGQTVHFHTGLCVIAPNLDGPRLHVETVTTRFHDLSDDAIRRYVEAEDVTATAGSMKAEGLGITLASSIDSRDPTALIGLPLIALCRMLRDAGFDLP